MKGGTINIIILAVICCASFILAVPTIKNNIDNPNLITYFNSDEGYLMDLVWYYYNGEKRPSYQMDVDYGLEGMLVSDLAHTLFSKFVDFTPGRFVLVLRWIHLLSWIAALIALWYLIGYHFASGSQQILVVLLLAVRPSFDYLLNNLKPEPLVLLLMVAGLNYTLRLIDKPSWRVLLIAILYAVFAFHIKYAGVFLLPAIIAAMYFGQHNQRIANTNYNPVFPIIKKSWFFESLIGIAMILLPVVYILLYVRKSTGATFYQEYGILGSLFKYKAAIFVIIAGSVLTFLPLLLSIFSKRGRQKRRNIIAKLNEINSYVFIAGGLFFVFLLVFGMRWLFSLENFLITHSYNLFDFTGIAAVKGLGERSIFSAFLHSFVYKMRSFDILILILFVFYLFVEFSPKFQDRRIEKAAFYKRMVILVFLLPFFLSFFSIGRFTEHHMLPFFVAICILCVRSLYMFISDYRGRGLLKYLFIMALVSLFTVDIYLNAYRLAGSRIYQYRQREDIAFEIADWMYEHIPLDSRIVSDQHTNVYVPPKYLNIRSLAFGEQDRTKRLASLVSEHNAEYLYYNANERDNPWPPIQELLPNKRVLLMKEFNNSEYYYQRKPNARFVLYKVLN